MAAAPTMRVSQTAAPAVDGLSARLLAAAIAAIREAEDELTRLDSAIGDGDHGRNMRRGVDAIAREVDAIAAMPVPEALHRAGTTLVMNVGGAAGPLYGSLLMGMGRAAAKGCEGVEDWARIMEAGVAETARRGRSGPGAKTLLDVLVPVAEAVRGTPRSALAGMRAAADAGLAATRPMRARKGRAAFLGERSIGHLDPGAASAACLVHALVGVLDDALPREGTT